MFKNYHNYLSQKLWKSDLIWEICLIDSSMQTDRPVACRPTDEWRVMGIECHMTDHHFFLDHGGVINKYVTCLAIYQCSVLWGQCFILHYTGIHINSIKPGGGKPTTLSLRPNPGHRIMQNPHRFDLGTINGWIQLEDGEKEGREKPGEKSVIDWILYCCCRRS
jgi:hypothetical protein